MATIKSGIQENIDTIEMTSRTAIVFESPAVFHWCMRWKMDKLGTESEQGY